VVIVQIRYNLETGGGAPAKQLLQGWTTITAFTNTDFTTTAFTNTDFTTTDFTTTARASAQLCTVKGKKSSLVKS
jgi:hypothetical protein